MAGIETANFPPGKLIFKEGDKPDGVYFVLAGSVEVSRMENGIKVVLAKLGPDAVFGEMALIDNQPRSATVTSTANTECMKGTSENFSALIQRLDPQVKAVMQQIVTIIRDKNKLQKAQMTPADVAQLNGLKQKAEQLKQQVLTNAALLEKIKTLDPFLNGIFNSLLKLLLA